MAFCENGSTEVVDLTEVVEENEKEQRLLEQRYKKQHFAFLQAQRLDWLGQPSGDHGYVPSFGFEKCRESEEGSGSFSELHEQGLQVGQQTKSDDVRPIASEQERGEFELAQEALEQSNLFHIHYKMPRTNLK